MINDVIGCHRKLWQRITITPFHYQPINHKHLHFGLGSPITFKSDLIDQFRMYSLILGSSICPLSLSNTWKLLTTDCIVWNAAADKTTMKYILYTEKRNHIPLISFPLPTKSDSIPISISGAEFSSVRS